MTISVKVFVHSSICIQNLWACTKDLNILIVRSLILVVSLPNGTYDEANFFCVVSFYNMFNFFGFIVVNLTDEENVNQADTSQ